MPERPLTKVGPRGHCVVHWAPTEAALKRRFPDCANVSKIDFFTAVRACRHYVRTGRFRENSERFKAIEGEKDLYEIKGHQARLLGFFDGTKFVVVHCVQKQQDRHTKSNLEKARKLRESYYAAAHRG